MPNKTKRAIATLELEIYEQELRQEPEAGRRDAKREPRIGDQTAKTRHAMKNARKPGCWKRNAGRKRVI